MHQETLCSGHPRGIWRGGRCRRTAGANGKRCGSLNGGRVDGRFLYFWSWGFICAIFNIFHMPILTGMIINPSIRLYIPSISGFTLLDDHDPDTMSWHVLTMAHMIMGLKEWKAGPKVWVGIGITQKWVIMRDHSRYFNFAGIFWRTQYLLEPWPQESPSDGWVPPPKPAMPVMPGAAIQGAKITGPSNKRVDMFHFQVCYIISYHVKFPNCCDWNLDFFWLYKW